VEAGEIIAWLESAELGEAKVNYLAKMAEISCCSIELTRAQQVHDNTLILLDLLKSDPSPDSLMQVDEAAMGTNRSDLIAAYVELGFARKAYERETQLFEKKITSEEEYLQSESTYQKAGALYSAVRDRIAFDVRRNLLDARRARQVSEMDLKSAERQLYVLGLAPENIRELERLAKSSPAGPAKEECNDPNCPDCKRTRALENPPKTEFLDGSAVNERLAWYPLRAPFKGTLIDKHITLGEVVKDDAGIFVLADLSTVWVDLRVHLKDLPFLKKGQPVTMTAGPGVPEASGVIEYLDPVIDPRTRTALARVILPNPTGA